MKVAINTCYGGFSLSREAYEHIGIKWDKSGDCYEEDRTDPKLIACIEALGRRAWGQLPELKVVEIPDGIEWFISNHAGKEHVAQEHQTWG